MHPTRPLLSTDRYQPCSKITACAPYKAGSSTLALRCYHRYDGDNTREKRGGCDGDLRSETPEKSPLSDIINNTGTEREPPPGSPQTEASMQPRGGGAGCVGGGGCSPSTQLQEPHPGGREARRAGGPRAVSGHTARGTCCEPMEARPPLSWSKPLAAPAGGTSCCNDESTVN